MLERALTIFLYHKGYSRNTRQWWAKKPSQQATLSEKQFHLACHHEKPYGATEIGPVMLLFAQHYLKEGDHDLA